MYYCVCKYNFINRLFIKLQLNLFIKSLKEMNLFFNFHVIFCVQASKQIKRVVAHKILKNISIELFIQNN